MMDKITIQPEILIVGFCDNHMVQDELSKRLSVSFINCELADIDSFLFNSPTYVAIILTVGIMHDSSISHSILQKINMIHPDIPVLCMTNNRPTKEKIIELSKYGIIETIILNDGLKCIEIIEQKLKIFIKMYYYRMQLVIEIKEKQQLLQTYTKNNQKYIDILKSSSTGFVILNSDHMIEESNEIFASFMGQSTSTDLQKQDIRDFIFKKDHDIFDAMWNRLIHEETVYGYEFRVVSQNSNTNCLWICVNGAHMETKQIVLVARNISDKKNTENKNRIDVQKKRDLLRQKIMIMRNLLRSFAINTNKGNINGR